MGGLEVSLLVLITRHSKLVLQTLGIFFVKLHVRFKHDGFEWVLVPVYGAAQDAHKAEFLAELARMGDSGSTPSLIGGISTFSGEKRIRIMIILSHVGPSFLMPLLRV
jgi:hypothetical protein